MEWQWRGTAADPVLAALNDIPARKVDPDAERFVQDHHPRVRTYLTASGCPRPLADEIANDSALIMVKKWDRLHADNDAGRTGHGDVGLRAYLFKTGTRLWYRYGPPESRWRDDLMLDTPAGMHVAEDSNHGPLMHDMVIDQLTASSIVHLTLPKLAPPYRKVLWLRHAEDFSTQITAEILHIPENTVKTQLRVAIRLFKDHLKATGALTDTAWEGAL